MGYSAERLERRALPAPLVAVPAAEDVLLLRQRVVLLDAAGEDRAPLTAALVAQSCEVVCESEGHGRAPVRLWRLWRALRQLKPDIVLSEAEPLPLIAAWAAGVRRVAVMIDELGATYAPGGGWRRRLARALADWRYRMLLRFAHTIIVANKDDRATVARRFLGGEDDRVRVAPGAGVDPETLAVEPLPEGVLTFVMIAPLTRDKGAYEFAEAARRLKEQQLDLRFVLVGEIQAGRNAVPQADVESWVQDGRLEHDPDGGARDWIRKAHAVVLPSYREGCPRVVMEAMALGRPCIVSDAPGCRDLVTHLRDGVVVARQSAAALAEGMTLVIRTRALLAPWARAAAWSAKTKFSTAGRAAAAAAALLGHGEP